VQDVELKINRAEQHIRDVQTAHTLFLNSHPYTIAVRHHPQTGQPIYYLAEARDVPAELPLISGDALHNLRSALDYLACTLVRGNGEIPNRNTGFPVLQKAPLSPKDELFARKVKGMKQAVIDAIWDIGSYKGGDNVLWRLHSLDNIDKHRLLVTLGHYFIDFDSAQHLAEIKPVIPRGPAPRFIRHRWIGTKHLKVGDDVLIDIPGAAVNPRIKFTFDVAFHEPGVCEEPLMDVLLSSLNRVKQIVSVFA
jgi:hypothetical protein